MDKACVGRHQILFSAYAEVFPDDIQGSRHWVPFLCLRRGVSGTSIVQEGDMSFSLPTQRCFSGYCSGGERRELFSAYAEVFLKSPKISLRVHSFLCLRRGVSPGYRKSDRIAPLFSAYAEVFPRPPTTPIAKGSFLCLRRGVSSL